MGELTISEIYQIWYLLQKCLRGFIEGLRMDHIMAYRHNCRHNVVSIVKQDKTVTHILINNRGKYNIT